MVAIIAIGSNDIQVPCLFFNTKEEAKEFLISKGCDDRHSWFPVPEEKQDTRSQWWEDFFTSVYFGCGGVYSFRIKEIEIGKPLVCFDLD